MLFDEDSIHMCLIGCNRSSKGVNAYQERGVARSRLQVNIHSYRTYNTLIPSYVGYFVNSGYQQYKKTQTRSHHCDGAAHPQELSTTTARNK
jgi:hypothetical protein